MNRYPRTAEGLTQIEELKQIPLPQLEWLIQKSKVLKLSAGEYLFEKGDPIIWLYILLEGTVDLMIEQAKQYKLFDSLSPGAISGLLPYSRADKAVGYGLVKKDACVIALSKEHFREMIETQHELTTAFVHVMTTRVRQITKNNIQTEKMMALGKLSAGLAHELNNPAAAMVRSAKELKKQLGAAPEKFKRVMSMRATDQQVDALNNCLFGKLHSNQADELSLLERNEKEEELEEWLEDHGVQNPYDLSETLLDFQLLPKEMENIYQLVGEKNFPGTIEWIENVLTTEKLVNEIEESADRISKLVGSVKSYTHMDRAQEKEAADLSIGIRNTLTMLNHKLKKKQISVEKEFPGDFPKIPIFISQLNQVWTNLIDNAIDALPEGGRLQIRALIDGDFAKVQIIDNGSGIPAEVIDNIFDPFFTTKAIGEGTGMGLEIAQNIMLRHNGNIKVKSQKGETVFTVCLPIQ